MNILTVDKVKQLCKEVLKLCNEYERISKEREYMHEPKLTGELRRRSMDLTRALAQMRKF